MSKYYQTDGRRVVRGRVTPKMGRKERPELTDDGNLPVWALPQSVQLSLAELAGTVKEGLLAFAVATGFEVMYTMMEADVEALSGPKARHDPAARPTATGQATGSSASEAGAWPCAGPGCARPTARKSCPCPPTRSSARPSCSSPWRSRT